MFNKNKRVMRKVYQTIVDKGSGNCVQAVVASLLEKNIDEVPNFISFGSNWRIELYKFFVDMGYSNNPIQIYRGGHNAEELIKIAKFDGGINGYLFAVVPSQTYSETTHAVVVDMNLKIVHDPNPNGKALMLTPDDVLSILVLRDLVTGKTGKIFTTQEWNTAIEKEGDINTNKIEKITLITLQNE